MNKEKLSKEDFKFIKDYFQTELNIIEDSLQELAIKMKLTPNWPIFYKQIEELNKQYVATEEEWNTIVNLLRKFY